jgi:hypothetical protein
MFFPAILVYYAQEPVMCAGVLVCWCAGVLVCWCAGVLVYWCTGVLVCWCAGVFSLLIYFVICRHWYLN